MSISAFNISEDFAKLCGMKAWGLRRTHGSMFFLEFGEPIQIGKFLHGKWHFLFQQCDWLIRLQENVVISSDDEPKSINGAFDELHLGQLTDARINTSNDLQLAFNSGHVLTASSVSDPEPDFSEWTLFTPDEMCWNKKPSLPPNRLSIHEPTPEPL